MNSGSTNQFPLVRTSHTPFLLSAREKAVSTSLLGLRAQSTPPRADLPRTHSLLTRLAFEAV